MRWCRSCGGEREAFRRSSKRPDYCRKRESWRGEWRGERKDGGTGLGRVGWVVRWDGSCDGEVVGIHGDGEGGRWGHGTIDAVEFVGEESVTGRGWRENEVLIIGWCGV